MSDLTCENCAAFLPHANNEVGVGGTRGRCRRYPPSFKVNDSAANMSKYRWPEVREDDWCLEWMEK